MASCNLYAWRNVTLDIHSHCTMTVARSLYGRDWVYVARLARIPRLSTDDYKLILDATALLHDVGKAVLQQRSAYTCHEVYGAILLAAKAQAAASPLERLVYALSGIVAYLHHHGMGSERYRRCLRGLVYSKVLKEFRSVSHELKECLTLAADTPRLRTIASRVASEVPYRLVGANLSLILSQAALDAMRRLGCVSNTEYLLSRLASTLVGFVSISDSVSALVEGREGEVHATCSKPSRYYVRVLCEKLGFNDHKLAELLEDLRRRCACQAARQ